jgi:hypothetical protein
MILDRIRRDDDQATWHGYGIIDCAVDRRSQGGKISAGEDAGSGALFGMKLPLEA